MTALAPGAAPGERTSGLSSIATAPGGLAAAVMYLAIALAITWPLAPSLGRVVAGDLGDPLMVIWVMSWVSSHLTSVLQGDIGAFARMWDAPIFFPQQNTLAMSEHFAGPAISMLPLWWITGNPMLIYNVAMLATFVLTALATFLLTRAFTGGFVAPLVAGAMAAFNTYRLGLEHSHLHVLSIQWFLFALLALHRFIQHGSHWSLAGLALSLLALNLSSGYYMLFCAPFLAAFAVFDMAAHRQLRNVRRWLWLSVAVIVAINLTVPFVLPYLRMQRDLGFVRSIDEVITHSARFDVYQAYVLPWAQVPIALAMVGLAGMLGRTSSAPRKYTVLMLVFLILAMALSLGPVVQPWGFKGPYWLLYQYVPGFSGLRIVNRYGALVLVFLPILAGIGAAWVVRIPRVGTALVAAAGAVFLWQIWPAQFPISMPLPSPQLAAAPAYLEPSPTLPAIYRDVQSLPSDAVLLELPFGDPWYELRYMFFAATHRRRLANGYSGVFPPGYAWRQGALARPLRNLERTARAISDVTHVIVHRRAWPDDYGDQIAAWLESTGAERLADEGDATLFQLKSLEKFARRE